MAKAKLSEKQYALLVKLYTQQGKIVDANAENWLRNLPPAEASKLIDAWIKKSRAKWRKP